MDFGHDTEHGLATVVDLVNSAPGDSAPGDSRGDSLGGLAALRTFVTAHDIGDIARLTLADLDAVHRLRTRLRSVFLPTRDADAVTLVNDLIADGRTTPRLTDHDDWPLHIHYFAPGARLAEHLAADCGMALAFVLAAGEGDRLRRCEAPTCGRVLVDLSRNRSRRYCDARTCGNRLHVAAYRARRRAG